MEKSMADKLTNRRYSEAVKWSVRADGRAVLDRNLDDERRHLEYVQSELHVRA